MLFTILGIGTLAESLILHLSSELALRDPATLWPHDLHGRRGPWELVAPDRGLTDGAGLSSDLLPGPSDSLVPLLSTEMGVFE